MTVRRRWRGVTIAAVSLAAMLPLAMAAYRSIDIALYDNLPEALRTLMGVPAGADIATLAYSVVFSSYGALTVAGVAIAVGLMLLGAVYIGPGGAVDHRIGFVDGNSLHYGPGIGHVQPGPRAGPHLMAGLPGSRAWA